MMMRKILLLLVLVVTTATAYSQIDVTAYTNSALGISTNRNKKISGELKLYMNDLIEDSEIELSLNYNFKERKYHRFSVGIGAASTISTLRDSEVFYLTLPVQLQVFPMQNFKRLSLVIEVAPQLNIWEDYNKM